MLSTVTDRPSPSDAGLRPLDPRQRWRAIVIATVIFAPGCWALIAGLVGLAGDDVSTAAAGLAVAFGLSVIPFVFLVLAFLSGSSAWAPAAVIRAMLVSIPVGIVASAVAADAVTGIVAGVGAGAVFALRSDDDHPRRSRFVAVAVAVAYTFVAARGAPGLLLPITPVLPLTAVGLADHWSDRRRRTQP
jgi:hypothetical protein